MEVSPFLDSLGCVAEAPIVTAAITYDDHSSGRPVLIVIHQAIYIKGMKHNLLCPMQLRHSGVTVNDRPKHCSPDPTKEDHSIIFPDGNYLIPLSLQGVTSYFPTRTPTKAEAAEFKVEGDYVELTADTPTWDPNSMIFNDLETRLVNEYGEIVERPAAHPRQLFMVATDASLHEPFRKLKVFATVTKRPGAWNAEFLAQNWGIGTEAAERTLRATTQRGVRMFDGNTVGVERRFPTGDRHLRYRRLNHALYHDTLFSSVKSQRGNTCSQVYATDFCWSRNFPMKSKNDAHYTLDDLYHRYGVPSKLISDNAKELTQGQFAKKAREAQCPIDLTDPYSPFQNRAESEIRELKRLSGRWMVKMRSPKVLWDHCLELSSRVRSATQHNLYQLKGEVPETLMTGETTDISHLCEYSWYEWVMYNDDVGFPEDKQKLGRYLGPTDPGIGSTMSYKILRPSGKLVRRTTVRKLTPQEWEDKANTKLRDKFDEDIAQKLGSAMTEADLSTVDGITTKGRKISAVTPEYEAYEDDDEKHERIKEVDDLDQETYDAYVLSQVMLPKGDEMSLGTVTKRKRNSDGKPIGRYNHNPILDSSVYEVEFPDGEVMEYAANVIAENLYTQVDEEGRHQVVFDEIVDHKATDRAMSQSEEDLFIIKNGRKHPRITTKGWKLCVLWKDGSTSWEPLSDLKEAYPLQTAEYATSNRLDRYAAFSWWVGPTLRRRNRIIASASNKRYHKTTHKFGIELPKTVREALEIDKRTGTTYWRDALALEIKDVRVAFDVLSDDDEIPPGYQRINCHVVFDIKMGSLRRKARLVAGGHVTDPPATITYASVVSRESVRIAFTVAALNDLDIQAGDIQNAYLNSPCEEKIWTVLGPEFGPELEGKRALLVRALYGLRSAGASYRYHLATCMEHLGFQSCKADPDVWLRENNDHTGATFYEYVLIYTDDILAIGKDPKLILSRLDKYFTLKSSSIGEPDIYLGAKIRSVVGEDGKKIWTQSSSGYIQEAIKNVESWLDEKNLRLPSRSDTPMSTTYRPELDTSPELSPETANWYQSAIGVLRWAIELGRIDIVTEVSMLASQMALPREGHLIAVLRIFSYLKKHHNSRLAFDPAYPVIDTNQFPRHDWRRFYDNVEEPLPPNAPKPLGKPVVIRIFVDADHAGDQLTRRSRTGYVMFINSAVINWYSKKQGSIEGATFGSEFMALKTVAEVNRGIRYKLRMMGIPIDGPSYVFGDNMSVLHNTMNPESTLKKKSNSIAYHLCRESVAMDEMRVAYVKTYDNYADLMTKCQPKGERRERLLRGLMWDIYTNLKRTIKRACQTR